MSAALSRNMKELRAARNLTQEGLAEAANLSRDMISGIEVGRSWPSKPTIMRLAKALGVKPIRLFLSEQDISDEQVLQRVAEALGFNVSPEPK